MVVLHHQFLRLYAHHSFHYLVHEFPVLHLLPHLLVEPLLPQQGTDVFEADPGVGEGVFHVFFALGYALAPDKIVEDFPEFGAEMAVEIFCLGEFGVCTAVHHDFLLVSGLLAVLLFFILLFFNFILVFLESVLGLD